MNRASIIIIDDVAKDGTINNKQNTILQQMFYESRYTHIWTIIPSPQKIIPLYSKSAQINELKK